MLKKIIFNLILSLSFFVAHGQDAPAPNKNILGGSFSFTATNNKTPELLNGYPLNQSFRAYRNTRQYHNIGFSVYAARSISKYWAIGLQVRGGDYGVRETYQDSILTQGTWSVTNRSNETSNISTGAAIFGRITFNPNQSFQVFAQPSLGYDIGTQTFNPNSIGGFKERLENLTFRTNVGVLYQMTPKWRGICQVSALNVARIIRKDETGKELAKINQTAFSLSNLSFGIEYSF
jgi:hypothetical protein